MDVLDALEEDLFIGEGGARASATKDRSRNTFSRSDCRGTVIDVDTEDEQPIVRVRDGASARVISAEDPLEDTVVDLSIPVSSLVTSGEHVLAVRASSTANAGRRMVVFAKPSKEIARGNGCHKPPQPAFPGEIEGHGVRHDKR